MPNLISRLKTITATAPIEMAAIATLLIAVIVGYLFFPAAMSFSILPVVADWIAGVWAHAFAWIATVFVGMVHLIAGIPSDITSLFS